VDEHVLPALLHILGRLDHMDLVLLLVVQEPSIEVFGVNATMAYRSLTRTVDDESQVRQRAVMMELVRLLVQMESEINEKIM